MFEFQVLTLVQLLKLEPYDLCSGGRGDREVSVFKNRYMEAQDI